MYENLKIVIDFFVSPFTDLIIDLGLADKSIKIGFGSIEWFDFTLLELTSFVMSFAVVFIFILIIYRVFKLLFRLITGGFL